MSRISRKLIRGLQEGKSTWQLHKNKSLYNRIKMVLYLTPILDPVFNIYYSITNFFSRVKRLIEYIPIIWNSKDWDYSYQLNIFKYGLKRLDTCMKNGHGVYNKSRQRKLKTAINLLERMENEWESYEEAHWDYIQAKYKKYEDPKAWLPALTIRDRMPAEVKEQYSKELKEKIDHKEILFKQDCDLFCKIMKKYMRSWWG